MQNVWKLSWQIWSMKSYLPRQAELRTELFIGTAQGVHPLTGYGGDLYKLGGKRKSKWQRRYFVLDDVGINWYRVAAKPELKGNLYAATITEVKAAPDPTGEGKFAFTIITKTKKNKEYILAADEEVDRVRWVTKIRDMITPE